MSARPVSPYWRKTRRLTMNLLVIWIVLTFGINWFARDLNHIVVLGFPLGFYLGAQGSMLLYLGLIWYYNRKMKKLDAAYGIADD